MGRTERGTRGDHSRQILTYGRGRVRTTERGHSSSFRVSKESKGIICDCERSRQSKVRKESRMYFPERIYLPKRTLFCFALVLIALLGMPDRSAKHGDQTGMRG